jgi:hypothetical protein
MLNLLLGIVLGGVALALLAYVFWLLFAAARVPLSSFLERQRFARHVARSERSDLLLRQNRGDEALPLLLDSFYLTTVHSRGLSGAVTNHHTGLLSRLIALTSDAQGGTVRLLSLAKTDRLLAERAALRKRYFSTRQGPSRTAVIEQLDANRRELRATLAQLVEEVRAARRQDRQQYH